MTIKGRKTAEAAVIDWLLHDDQVIREWFRHTAAILTSVAGASITAVMLIDKEDTIEMKAACGCHRFLVSTRCVIVPYSVTICSSSKIRSPTRNWANVVW